MSGYPTLTASSYDMQGSDVITPDSVMEEQSVEQSVDEALPRYRSEAGNGASGGGASPSSPNIDAVGTSSVDDDDDDDDDDDGDGRGKSLFDDTTTMHESVNPSRNGSDGDGDDDGDEGVEEEEVEVDRDLENGEGGYEDPKSPKSERSFNNEEDEDEDEDVDVAERLLEDDDGYERLVGDVCCWFRPTRAWGCFDFSRRTGDWLFLNKEQILSGITVGINQVPAVTTSAIIAGVSPSLALQSTWITNLITSAIGGGPGMVSGATTFIGLTLADLVRNEGVEYVFWAVMFAGILQVAFGLFGLGRIMRLIPRPLQVGFQNGMGLLLFATQFRYARVHDGGDRRDLIEVGHSWTQHTDRGVQWIDTHAFAAWGIGALMSFLTCLILPRLTRAVPSTFVGIVVATVLEWAIFRRWDHWHSPTIGDYADISVSTLKPVWLEYDMPLFNLDTFKKVYLHGLGVFGVGLMESLLTLNLVDELNEVSGLRNRVSFGQGFANVVSSIFGGMGGAGMVGQSMVANKADGITGLSTFLTGITMVIIIFGAYPLINFIPLSAFAGIMFYSAHNLIEYRSILTGLAALLPESLRDAMRLDYKIPRVEVLIMLAVTVLILVFDLAIAVCAGVLMAVFVYVWDSSARVVVEREPSDNGESVTYNVSGPLFFATAQGFVDIFAVEDIEMDPEDVIIMLEGAEVHDSSGMFALKRLHDRFVAMGKTVALSSLSPTSRRLMEKYASTWEGVSFLEIEEIEEEEEEEEDQIVGDDEVIENYDINTQEMA